MKTQNPQYSGKTSIYNDICTETHGLPNPAWVSSSHITNTKMGPEKWQRWNTSSPKPLGLTACPDETREISPPTSLLDDSQRGSQEGGSKVLSLQTRAEQNPRSGKARFPGPTPPSLPSAVLLRSSPSEPPSFRRPDGPFPAPVNPRETPRPAAHRGGAPLSLPRLSKIGKHPAPLSHGEPPPPRPFTPQPLPPHLQPTSDLPPGPKGACPGAPPLPYVPAYVPARRRNSVTVRLVPPGGSV